MSENFIVNAKVRDDLGKGASRRLRRENGVPAVIYGGHKDPVSLTLAANETVKHLESESFYSHILTINIDGAQEKAVLKDVQRHPSKEIIYHVDFQRISADEKLSMNVPLHFINEDNCVGVKAGGTVTHNMTDVAIACLPTNLPEYIEVDMAELESGHAIHMSDLVLPEGVEIPELALGDTHDQAVVSIHTKGSSSDADDAEEGGADEGAGE